MDIARPTGSPSIQQRLYPGLTCFGCGPANAKGLRLRSYPDGDGVVAAFTPWPEHDNGGGFLNGGIISTVLDCHSGAAVARRAEEMGLWESAAGSFLFVTAGLDVRYRRPTPLADALELRAVVTSADEVEVLVDAQIVSDGRVCAEARSRWRRWRPR